MSSDGIPGFKSVTDGLDDFNIVSFIFDQLLSGVATAQLFQVQTVTPGAGLLPGVVSGQIMVNQVGADGTAVPHGPIYNIPFFRLQGGKNAVINDPVVKDIGIAVFAARDISSVKANKAISNPGSSRSYDYADGLYFGGFLNGTPTQYVQFVNDGDGSPTGINIVDVNNNTIVTNSDGMVFTDANGNVIKMDSDGITVNDVLTDRDQNVSNIANLDTTGTSNLGGGSQAVKLADGSDATKTNAT